MGIVRGLGEVEGGRGEGERILGGYLEQQPQHGLPVVAAEGGGHRLGFEVPGVEDEGVEAGLPGVAVVLVLAEVQVQIPAPIQPHHILHPHNLPPLLNPTPTPQPHPDPRLPEPSHRPIQPHPQPILHPYLTPTLHNHLLILLEKGAEGGQEGGRVVLGLEEGVGEGRGGRGGRRGQGG